MRKIDLHIHTVQTISDKPLLFEIGKLKEYIEKCKLDCIAITNHNIFNFSQYKEICSALSIPVFPGIEIDLENGHLLLIANNSEVEDFNIKCTEVSHKITTKNDTLSIDNFNLIFSDYSRYLLIPHLSKDPILRQEIISQFGEHITAGEVSSPKKFKYYINDKSKLVPVYFSDIRIDEKLAIFPTRQTYLDIGEISLAAIKLALKDKGKVFLSNEKGHDFFEVGENGLKLSNGLNVILGERSTGKTYTLDHIYSNYENVKYIRQFELLEKDVEEDKKRFNNTISQNQSLFTQNYLQELKAVVDDLSTISIENNERDAERYLSTLLKNAKESEKEDSYAKAKLFNESTFSENDLESLKTLIRSVITIIDNTEYKEIIAKYVEEAQLKLLLLELIGLYTKEYEINLKKRWVNDLVNSIKKLLQVHTASTVIENIDLYKLAKDKKKIELFTTIIGLVKKEKVITNSEFQGFRIVAKTKTFSNATEMKNLCGKKIAFSDAYQAYDNAYEFLKELRKIEGLEESDYYRYFISVDYQVLNKNNYPVSGGERSEFRLLQEISDSQQFDMLLIDEPESSFDNLFLKNEVNQLIKGIARSMPVVIVTHNNTVGASIKPNYLLYTTKHIDEAGIVTYKIYSGYPTDKKLSSLDGTSIMNIDVMLNCLEAGQDAYEERGSSYEILKN